MADKFTCYICHKVFTRAHYVKVHLDKIHAPDRDDKRKNYPCPVCHKRFTRARDVKRHLDTVHNQDEEVTLTTLTLQLPSLPSLPSQAMRNDTTYQDLISQIKELKSELKERDEKLKLELKERDEKQKERDEQLKDEIQSELTTIKNTPQQKNILQVICITNNDNYLDMLTDKMGNFNRAVDYIKDCALSDVSGDCKLIEKIYDHQSFTTDRKKSKIYYYNENNEQISEQKDLFGRKLAHNLQNSYLRGINYLINRNLDDKIDPNKFLDSYDILSWNSHIYNLSDIYYQRKIMNQLNIPIKQV